LVLLPHFVVCLLSVLHLFVTNGGDYLRNTHSNIIDTRLEIGFDAACLLPYKMDRHYQDIIGNGVHNYFNKILVRQTKTEKNEVPGLWTPHTRHFTAVPPQSQKVASIQSESHIPFFQSRGWTTNDTQNQSMRKKQNSSAELPSVMWSSGPASTVTTC
jgi:hypothetical protein